jgi:hypothetical protein
MDPVALLKRRILLVLAALPLAGCAVTHEEVACMPAEEDGACPSVEAAEADMVGDGLCGDEIRTVDGEGTPSGEDTAGTVTSCCYPVTYVDTKPGMECIEGRPLQGARGPVIAGTVTSGSWAQAAAAGPDVAGLPTELRARLATAWTAAALAEHASVAAFAKVTLDLLAFAAPAELVSATQAAGADEVRHARRAFALASAYAGAPVAPGPLPLDGFTLGGDLAAFAAATVREGCIGETISALLAAEALAGATDPAVRAALEGIVRDETRHAALAWRTVRWAIQVGGAPVRAAVAGAFADALSGPLYPQGEGLVAGGNAHGRLEVAQAKRVVARAVCELLVPCAAALLAEPAGFGADAGRIAL